MACISPHLRAVSLAAYLQILSTEYQEIFRITIGSNLFMTGPAWFCCKTVVVATDEFDSHVIRMSPGALSVGLHLLGYSQINSEGGRLVPMGKVLQSVLSAPWAKGEALGPGQKALPFQHIQGYGWLTLSYVSVSSVCEKSCTSTRPELEFSPGKRPLTCTAEFVWGC